MKKPILTFLICIIFGFSLFTNKHDAFQGSWISNSTVYSFKNGSLYIDESNDEGDVYKNVFQKSNGTLNELVGKFCNDLGISNTENLNNFFIGKFSDNNINNTISNDKITLIRDLKENGYKVILFSNSCCLLNNDAIKEIYDLVDGVFYSYDIGYTKDDKESYQYVEKTLNVKPTEILHIGDTLKSDYLKPVENGWNALFYGVSDDESVNCISSLMELYDFFDIRTSKK